MKKVLWLNTIAETLIAIGMFAVPGAFFPGATGQAAAIARAFSFAILAVAFISASVTFKRVSLETERNAVGILTFYHLFQLVAQVAFAATYPPVLLPPVIIHTIFTTLFAAYLLKINKAVSLQAARAT